MRLEPELIENFSAEERSYIETLYKNNQLLITDNENESLPPGATHVLLVKPGTESTLIRKRFS